MAASNINRVIITGNLTADPELRSLPSGTSVCKLRVAVQHAPQGRLDRRVGRQAQLLRRHRLGRAGRELRALPVQGPPRRDRRAPGVARVGERGRQASARRSTSSPTPCSSSAAASERRRRRQRRRSRPLRRPGRHERLRRRAGRRRTAALRARPTTTSRSRPQHQPARATLRGTSAARRRRACTPPSAGASPCLGARGLTAVHSRDAGAPLTDWIAFRYTGASRAGRRAFARRRTRITSGKAAHASRPAGGTRRAAPAAAAASPARTARTRSSRSTTRTSRRCAGSSPSAARSARAGSRGACRRHQNQIATAVKRARELALLPYVRRRPRGARRARRPRSRTASARTASRCPRRSCSRTSRRSASKGTVVDVSKGYLRNYLIPRKLAAAGDQGRPRGRRSADARPPRSAPRARPSSSAARARRAAQQDGAHDQPAGRRRRPPVRLGHRRRTSPTRSRRRAASTIDRRKIHLDEPIKHVGTYMVVVEIADGVTATVKTMVVEQ